ncbi:hypothetical protein TOT_010000562 [Theileria orientalis strain Shintoku]|uniref:Uncharacterized protein n=1 Tax=Theileria orientalis strain Shintoku TaxID=869250 RepID=J4D5P5_THEOR|nr:hypothetical protein TOT_010000562 [Theileria orientalis strain Shintoku]BAM39100.1 hypothetical protein TOT_010000562 [Theileria orientalis strain Shintoku]|eukprot:XP_009689401.1 hypothetical protein TOT_010000562 [Theileria orientalis strain Shintoku]
MLKVYKNKSSVQIFAKQSINVINKINFESGPEYRAYSAKHRIRASLVYLLVPIVTSRRRKGRGKGVCVSAEWETYGD